MSNPSIFTSNSYTYMVFKSTATVTLPRANVDYLIIGGGGAGGKDHGGGGGAGRVIYGSRKVNENTYNIVVGSGGIGSSFTNGNSSSVFGITALGGGRGGGMVTGAANSGGSGGGGGGYNEPFSGGTAIASTENDLGNNGGNGSSNSVGGGGGGAGSIGSNSVGFGNGSSVGGIGGSGTSYYASLLSIINNIMDQTWKTATNNGQIISSGGSGGSWGVSSVTGPIGGGGNGGNNNGGPTTLPTNGIDNTGGGGGGGGSGGQTGADGGSGLVIIRYIVAPPCFKEGSKILTNLGYKRVEELIKGDMVKTLLNDYKPIAIIGKCDFNHPASKERIKKQLYKCSQNKYPELFEDLIITGCHSILVENSTSVVNETQIEKVKEVNGGIYLTDGKLRLPACIDERTSIYEGEKGIYTIYHLALENDDYYMNYGIYANGLLVESCSKRYLVELSGMELV